MRILVASTIVPFVEGGGTFIVDWLVEILRRHGHDVEMFKIPFAPHYRGALDQMLALRLMDFSDQADRLIAIRTPSYLLKHPKKILWFIHHQREVYDLWGTSYSEIPDTPHGRAHRAAIVAADNLAFSEASAIYTNSHVVRRRLEDYNGVRAEVVFPPLLDPDRFHCDSYGDFLFYPSRIAPHKRQHLAIEALALTKTPVRLVIAGGIEAREYWQSLEHLIDRHGLTDRAILRGGWLPEKEKIELFSRCLGALYLAFDEDSYGYTTLEAQHARKPVITASDSGGTRELIEDGDNGLIVQPSAEALAQAMDRLWRDRDLARRLGERGPANIEKRGISWDRVVDRMLA